MSGSSRDFDRAALIASESPAERARNTAILQEVISLHRSPWSRIGRTYRSREHDYVVVREHLSTSYDPFVRNDRFTLTRHGEVIASRQQWSDIERLIEQRKGQHP